MNEEKEPACEVGLDAEVDETLAETFPASDPPQWTLGIDPHCESGAEVRETEDTNEDETRN
jgi:hypothetical protein